MSSTQPLHLWLKLWGNYFKRGAGVGVLPPESAPMSLRSACLQTLGQLSLRTVCSEESLGPRCFLDPALPAPSPCSPGKAWGGSPCQGRWVTVVGFAALLYYPPWVPTPPLVTHKYPKGWVTHSSPLSASTWHGTWHVLVCIRRANTEGAQAFFQAQCFMCINNLRGQCHKYSHFTGAEPEAQRG